MSENHSTETTDKPRFYSSAEINPIPLDEHWNPLALAEARRHEFLRSVRVTFGCPEGHQHETYEAAAECMAERFTSTTGAIVEAERAGHRPAPQATDQHEHGVVAAIELETRNFLLVRQHKIAATLALKPGGPTRLLFDAGGHVDVCGSAEYWWRAIEIARLEDTTDAKAP